MIKLSKSVIGAEEKRAVLNVLEGEFLGMGKKVQEFEQRLTDFFGREAVCVVNGTAALHLALQACGIGPGDEVIAPSLTYVATFQAISATGAIPVACDINPETLQIDISSIKKHITRNTKAIVPVHYSGQPCELDKIFEIAKANRLRVIEDAAHALGSHYYNRKIGSFGDIACFSFDGIKNITSGEGGCVVSDDIEVLRKIKDSRLLGVEKDTEKRFSGQRSWLFDVNSQGWRYHMSDLMAAIGIEQLKKIAIFANRRRALAKLYDIKLQDNDYVVTIHHNYDEIIPHIYVIVLKPIIDRKKLIDEMFEMGVQVGIHYNLNHKLTFYKSKVVLPVAEELSSRLLSLPLHASLTDNNVCDIVDILNIAVSKCQQK